MLASIALRIVAISLTYIPCSRCLLLRTAPQIGAPIPVGTPYNVNDFDLDAAASVVMETGYGMRLDSSSKACSLNKPHFFSDTDCGTFTSKAACTHARSHITYLSTYPGSGNTWARYVLEGALQIYTGSVYPDWMLHRLGMLGEGIRDPHKVFTVKTHWPISGGHSEGAGVKNLVIVRDPLHAALSYMQLNRRSHTEEVPEQELIEVFNARADDMLVKWASMARTMRDRNDTLIVRFEDIVRDTRGEYLQTILPYLSVNVQKPGLEERLDCIIQAANDNYGGIRRNHTHTFTFTDDHKALARQYIGDELLEHYGYKLS